MEIDLKGGDVLEVCHSDDFYTYKVISCYYGNNIYGYIVYNYGYSRGDRRFRFFMRKIKVNKEDVESGRVRIIKPCDFDKTYKLASSKAERVFNLHVKERVWEPKTPLKNKSRV